jgi:hypothetical protein
MKRYFICLANSRKRGGRCIAGIEINFDSEQKKYSLIKTEGRPVWLRPVSNTEHGEVDTDLVKNIFLNNIVELDATTDASAGYQSENIKFTLQSIKKAGKISVSKEVLDGFAEEDFENIFGNVGKAVHPDRIEDLKRSIFFIKVENPSIHKQTNNYDGKITVQHRMHFSFKGTDYDFSLTDPVFVAKYEADNEILKSVSDCYLTISLGVLHLGWYSKLVAGVVVI